MTAEEAPRRMQPYVYQIDLSDARPGYNYVLKAAGGTHPLTPHTAETRAAARAADRKLAGVADSRLTHFSAQAMMPLDRVCRVHVAAIPRNASDPNYVHLVAITCPEPEPSASVAFQTLDYISTAQSLLFHHPDLMANDPRIGRIVKEHLELETARSTYEQIELLAEFMKGEGPPAKDSGWARLEPVKGVPDQFFHQPTAETQKAAGPAMTSIQKSTKNDPRLKDKKWTQEQGFSVVTDRPAPPFSLVTVIEAGGDGEFKARLDKTTRLNGLKTSIVAPQQAGNANSVTLRLENHYVRYLGAYIQFLDADFNPMNTPDWVPDSGPVPVLRGFQYDNYRALGGLSPIMTIAAIPVPSEPGTLEVSITFPPGAVAAGIYGLGLGTGENLFPKAIVYGAVLTGLTNLAIPSFLLAFGVASLRYDKLYKTLQDNKGSLAILTLGEGLFYIASIADKARVGEVDWNNLSKLGGLIFQTGFEAFLTFVEESLLVGKAVEQIPFAGWIMLAINIAIGVAQIAQTVVQVVTSPFAIPNRITTSITSAITIRPDPSLKRFPRAVPGVTRSFNVKLVHEGEQPTMSVTAEVPPTFEGQVLEQTITNNLGGRVRIQCDFYVGAQVAASASTALLPNDAENTSAVPLVLFEPPIELTGESIYKHASLLTYQNGAYTFMPTPEAPQSTIKSLSSDNTGNAISQLSGLTLSQRHQQLGYAWKAAGLGIAECATGSRDTQLFGLQNVDIPGVPMLDTRFSACGYSALTNLLYDPYPAKFLMNPDGSFELRNGLAVPDPTDKDHGFYYIDPLPKDLPAAKGGGYHLRRIPQSGTDPINPQDGKLLSFGRFPFPVDSAVIHPSGRVVAISRTNSKIMVTALETEGRPDDDVPLGSAFAGQAMNYVIPGGAGTEGRRAGLLANPIAAASTYDGTVMVLEDLKSNPAVSRVQAFDSNGNPVNAFPAEGQLIPFFDLPHGRTYLDLAVVGNADLTYLYILYYEVDGKEPADYNVAIYQTGTNAGPENPLVTTNGVSAARLAVDLFRTLYTLNWSMTTDGKGNPAGPPTGEPKSAGRTVPSLSEWLPPRSRP